MLYLNQKCGHEANRAKVCSPCEIKNLGQRFTKAENFSLIRIETTIKQFISEEFDVNSFFNGSKYFYFRF